MKALNEIIQGSIDPNTMTVRLTGRTLDQWDAEWARRRLNGILSKRLSGSTLYTLDEREKELRYYDLSDDDFEPVVAKTIDQPHRLPDAYRGFPVVTLHPSDAEAHIARHIANWKDSGSCPPLKAVLLYRIRQSALSRIANEPRPEQARAANY
jgi:hypothetical protein